MEVVVRVRQIVGAVLVVAVMALPAAAHAATYTVNTTADPAGAGCAGGTCSLRQALNLVNGGSGGDTIVIPAIHITLTQGFVLSIDKPVTITGAGARESIIDANSTSSVFTIDTAASPVTIEAVTITGGSFGGISNSANLTLRRVAVADNHTASAAGGISNDVTGTITIDQSLITGNTAATVGGGIYTQGPTTIRNSTISGNTGNGSASTWEAGGVYASSPSVSITNTTITGNSAHKGGGVTVDSGTVTFKNTIVAGNTATGAGQPGNCLNGGATFTSEGGNLENAATCSFAQASDKPNTLASLAALANNGGPTDTHALQAGSAAIDAGVPTGCPTTDQRDAVRPALGGCDIGAYERGPAATTGSASAVGETAATVSGTAGPNLRATTYRFEYGTSPAYGSVTPDQDAGAGAAPVAASAALSGLTPATTYHYRLVVTNAEGTAVGADQSFTTATPDSGQPPPGPTPAPADATAPLLTLLTLTPVEFRAVRSGGSIARAKSGTTVRYRLSEAAITTFRVERVLRGVRVGGRCVRPTRANRGAKRCTRYVARRGSFRHAGKVGANRFRFTGRLRRRPLTPGTYRLSARATDAAGNTGRPVRRLFRIVR